MSSPRFDSVEGYLASLDPVKAGTLSAVIDAILAEFPDLQSKLAWNVPQIHRGKDYVFGVSAAKHHLSLNPWSEQVIEAFRARLEPEFVVLQSVFQVPVDWDADRGLLADLVRARIAELDRS
jgi:uncharacterized protein YdhG (YjbR/CyaY superfamily)